ncbi:unnamed protein product [Protopolystoma xenopodis]|uniref:Uncharacterized protein n=1 Tax=Protopolystoma xenopodis TaxID=117903 RepID=A0A3S5CH03_9PLAT|nr:unnamed protein product [Protopolystoma xenopodis]
MTSSCIPEGGSQFCLRPVGIPILNHDVESALCSGWECSLGCPPNYHLQHSIEHLLQLIPAKLGVYFWPLSIESHSDRLCKQVHAEAYLVVVRQFCGLAGNKMYSP